MSDAAPRLSMSRRYYGDIVADIDVIESEHSRCARVAMRRSRHARSDCGGAMRRVRVVARNARSGRYAEMFVDAADANMLRYFGDSDIDITRYLRS